MKWFLALIIVSALFLYARGSSIDFNASEKNENSTESVKTVVPTNKLTVSYDSRSYQLIYEKISEHDLTLIPNFEEKRSGSSIAEENSCIVASSGGFYTPENKPLGLFKVNGTQIGKISSNRTLLTGFLYSLEDGTIGIDTEAPAFAPTILQAGPLFENGTYFSTRQDEFARRIVVFEDTFGDEYIGSLIGTANSYEGPRLSDLPPLMFSIQSPFKVNRVLNLDGGSASFFKDSSGYTLSELVAVGSIICIR